MTRSREVRCNQPTFAGLADLGDLALLTDMRVLIVGCGYVGLPLGAELVRQGHEVFGLRRSTAADRELEAAGVTPLHADISEAATLEGLPQDFDGVVNCAASGGGGVEDYRRVYLRGTQNLLVWLRNTTLRRYVYTSSTGVYGQDDGSWVKEDSVTEPAGETNRVLVETEQLLLKAAREGFPAVVLRLAGIYGPGRGYWLRQFLNGQARIEGDGSRILNMVHRDDVVIAIIAALERASGGSVFNVVDDEPVTQRDLFAWLAAELRRPLPSASTEDATTRRRAATSKRVSNQRLKSLLGFDLNYPTFREGYCAEIKRLGQTEN